MLSTKTIAYLIAHITCSLSVLTAYSTPQIDTSPKGISEPHADQTATGETLKKYPHLSWDEQKRTIGEGITSYTYG